MSSLSPVKDRLIRTALLAAIGLCLGALIAGVSALSSKKNDNTPAILNVAGVGGPFELTDQDGKTRSEKDFAGKYKLIYFGFTSCPAICPTELQKTAEAYKELSDSQKDQIQLIFITVDPERDTAKVLKKYVELFDPSMVGLTGTLEQIEAVKSEFKVYAAKVPDGPSKDDYTMDHSSFIYFMSPDDKLITLFKTQQTASEMEDFIRKYLKKNAGK
ncbi:MAG: SCO family protein [Micavibrio aeruginosavorus]|uniref:SCO family protein n=1 Tax=Micavibrio aeruginosavorus TaxID=349221 RepID=A0A2W5FNT5_9BACT|nr:MAG: SCO family protein [Micavibrio aeruginosavorus]